jgi:4-aminobutyrate aminotransferase-like enzyme
MPEGRPVDKSGQTHAIRMMPPLIIGDHEVDEAVAILDRVLSGMGNAPAK